MYAIIDIETTGGNARFDRITEIAVFIHDGEKVVDEYITLVNPERSIPYSISMLTGITNEMVADAPRFYEVAKRLVEITTDCIFVAHNVNFDYRFIQHEFLHLGYKYDRETLCTVQLSRKILPGHASYSLGNLCRDLNITIEGRHRAGGDALATTKLFDIIISRNGGLSPKTDSQSVLKKHLHPKLDFTTIKSIPEQCGVYFFYNDKNQLIYVGKSLNIRKRVLSHLSNTKTNRASRMMAEIASIDYELTGNELIALLKESHEIKVNKPVYNRAQRRTASRFGIFQFFDPKGYSCFNIASINNDEPVASFETREQAVEQMERWCKKFELCQKLCGLYPVEGSCFYHQTGMCHGACVGLEFPFSYNMRVDAMLDALKYHSPNMAIITNGRSQNEKAVIWVENGTYLGYGYFDETTQISQLSELKDVISMYPDNRDIQNIINGFIRKQKGIKIETF